MNAANPARVTLIPTMRARSSPYGCPAWTRLTSSPSTSGLGRRRRVVWPSPLRIEADLLAGASGCANPAKRFERAADGRAVRPHQNMPIAPTSATAPRMTVRFMVPFLVVSASQRERVDDLVHPDGSDDHEDPGDDERNETHRRDVRRAKASGLTRHCQNAISRGSTVRIRADKRPSAVRVPTWRAMRCRSRIVALTVSRISDRLPPVSRLMSIAATTHSRSSLSMRRARARMASDKSRPRRDSTSTWANSLRAGSSASSATESSAWVRPKPLRSEVVTSWRTSGN